MFALHQIDLLTLLLVSYSYLPAALIIYKNIYCKLHKQQLFQLHISRVHEQIERK